MPLPPTYLKGLQNSSPWFANDEQTLLWLMMWGYRGGVWSCGGDGGGVWGGGVVVVVVSGEGGGCGGVW